MVALRVDGPEIGVRRARASRPGRRAFVSGKKKQNTLTFTEFTGPQGRTLWAGCFRPGRIPDQTAIKCEGIDGLLADYPDVAIEMDDGYRGLARDYPGQVTAPPKKLRKDTARSRDPDVARSPACAIDARGSAPATALVNSKHGGPYNAGLAAGTTYPKPLP